MKYSETIKQAISDSQKKSKYSYKSKNAFEAAYPEISRGTHKALLEHSYAKVGKTLREREGDVNKYLERINSDDPWMTAIEASDARIRFNNYRTNLNKYNEIGKALGYSFDENAIAQNNTYLDDIDNMLNRSQSLANADWRDTVGAFNRSYQWGQATKSTAYMTDDMYQKKIWGDENQIGITTDITAIDNSMKYIETHKGEFEDADEMLEYLGNYKSYLESVKAQIVYRYNYSSNFSNGYEYMSFISTDRKYGDRSDVELLNEWWNADYGDVDPDTASELKAYITRVMTEDEFNAALEQSDVANKGYARRMFVEGSSVINSPTIRQYDVSRQIANADYDTIDKMFSTYSTDSTVLSALRSAIYSNPDYITKELEALKRLKSRSYSNADDFLRDAQRYTPGYYYDWLNGGEINSPDTLDYEVLKFREDAIPVMEAELYLILGKDTDEYKDILSKVESGEADKVGNMINRSFIKDEEKTNFLYLEQEYGEDIAEAYYKGIKEGINARVGEFVAGKVHELDKYIWGAEENLAFLSGVNDFIQGTRRSFGQDVAYSSLEFAGQYARENVRAESSWIEPFVYDVMYTAGNMAPSILVSVATGQIAGYLGAGATAINTLSGFVGSVTMGASARGNAYKQARMNGASREAALNYSAAVGVSEIAMSSLLSGVRGIGGNILKSAGSSKVVGTLFQSIANVDKAWYRIASEYGKDMFSEGLEEYLQETLEPAYANLFLGENNEITLVSEEQAYAALLGMIMAGGFNVPSISSEIKTAKAERAVTDMLGLSDVSYYDPKTAEGRENLTFEVEQVKSLIQQNKIDPDSELAEQVLSLQNKLNKGKIISESEIRDFLMATMKIDYTESNYSSDMTGSRAAYESAQARALTGMEHGYASADISAEALARIEAQRNADIQARAENGGDVTVDEVIALANSSNDEAVQSALISIVKKYSDVSSVISKKDAAQLAPIIESSGKIESAAKAILAFKSKNSNPVNADNVGTRTDFYKDDVLLEGSGAEPPRNSKGSVLFQGDAVEITEFTGNGNVKIKTVAGVFEVPINSLDSMGYATEYMLETVDRMKYGTDEAKLYMNAYDGKSDIGMYTRAFEMFYTGGMEGSDFSKLVEAAKEVFQDRINYDLMEVIYDSAKAHAEKYRKQKLKKARKDVKGNVRGSGVKKLSKAEQDVFNAFARAFKVDIEVWSSGDGALGSAEASARRIMVALDSKNPISTLLHESGHIMEAWAPETYSKIKEAVLSWYAKEQGENLDTMIESKVTEYLEKGDKSITRRKAESELVNNALEAIQDSESFAESISETMAELGYSKSKAEGVLQSIKEFFVNLKNAIVSYLNKKGSDKMITAEGKYMAKHADMELLDNLLELYNQGMREVRNNYDAYVNGERSGEVDLSERFMYETEENSTYPNLTETEKITGEKFAIFVDSVTKMLDKSKISKRKHKIGDITFEHAEIIEDLMREIYPNFNVHDYEVWVDGTAARHIERRHGKNGEADHSMAKTQDKMMVPWVLNSPDTAEFIRDKDGNLELSDRYTNFDDTPAPQIRLTKHYGEKMMYVSECVPDSSNKRIYITSAYKTKSSTNQLLNINSYESPQPTSETSFGDHATNGIIQRTDGNVNSENTEKDYQFLGDEASKTAELERISRLNKNLQKRNDAQANMIKTLLRQISFFNRGDFSVLDHVEVQKMAKQLIKNTGAKVSADKLGKRLSDLYDMMAHENSKNADKIQSELQSIATELVSTAEATNYEAKETIDGIKDITRGGIRLAEDQRGDVLHRYDSVSDYKNSVKGLKFRNDGVWLDDLWSELSATYPEYFDSEISHADQPIALAEVMETLNSNLKYNPFDEAFMDDNDSAIAEVVAQIVEGYQSIPAITDANTAYSAAYAKARAEFGERQKDIKAEYKRQVEQMRENYKGMERTLAYDTEIQRKEWREARYLTDEKNKVKRLMGQLSKMLDPKNKSKSYAPVEVYKALLEVCRAVDLGHNLDTKIGQKMERLRAEYKRMAEDERVLNSYNEEYSEVIEKNIDHLSRILKGRSIAELSHKEMYQLRTVLEDVYHNVVNARKQIGEKEGRENYDLGMQAIDEIKQASGRRGSTKLLDRAIKKAGDFGGGKNLFAVNIIDRIVDYNDKAVLKVLFDKLQEGKLKSETYKMEAKKFFRELRERNDGKDYADFVTKEGDMGLKGADGKKVRITHAQAAQLILTWEREQSSGLIKHLSDSGIVLPGYKQLMGGKIAKSLKNENFVKITHIDDATIGMLREQMNEYDLEWMSAAREYFNGMSRNAVNEISMQIFHRLSATSSNYIPMEVYKGDVKSDPEALNFNKLLENAGILKSIAPNATQPLVMMGLDICLERNIDTVADLYGLAVPLRNLQRVYNVRGLGEKGSRVSVKETLRDYWQGYGCEDETSDVIEQVLVDEQAGRRVSWGSSLYDYILNKRINMLISTNVSSAIKNYSAYITVASELSPTAWFAGIGRGFKGKKSIEAAENLIDQYTPIHFMRREGLSTLEIAELNKQSKSGKKGIPKKLRGGNWLQAIDVYVTRNIWFACEKEIEQNYKKKKLKLEKDGAFYNEVAKLYNKTIFETQPNYDVLHRNERQKTKNPITRQFTLFKTDMYVDYNKISSSAARAISKFKKVRGAKGDVKASARFEANQALKAFGKTALTQVVKLAVLKFVLEGLIGVIFHDLDDYRDEEGELKWSEYFSESGIGMLGDAVYTLTMPVSTFVDLFDTIRTIKSGITLYLSGGENMVMEAATDLLKATSDIYKAYDKLNDPSLSADEKKRMTIPAVYELAKNVGGFFGVPIGNIEKVLNSARLYAEGMISDNYGIYEIGYEQSDTQKFNIMYNALIEGDTEKYKEYEEKLLSERLATHQNLIEGVSGYITKEKTMIKDQDDIDGQIAERLAGHEVTHKVAESIMSSDWLTYDDATEELLDMGFTENQIDKAQKKIIDRLSEFAYMSENDSNYHEKYAKFIEWGFDDEDIARGVEMIRNISVYDGTGKLTSTDYTYSYKMLAEAVMDSDVDTIVRLYSYFTEEMEVESKIVKGALTRIIKPIYKDASHTQRKELREILSEYCGYDASKNFEKWLEE